MDKKGQGKSFGLNLCKRTVKDIITAALTLQRLCALSQTHKVMINCATKLFGSGSKWKDLTSLDALSNTTSNSQQTFLKPVVCKIINNVLELGMI
jgi:hypothetical protein